MRTQVTFKGHEVLAKALKHLGNGKGTAHVVREALNTTAFTARTQWHREMDSTLILRNNFTKKAVNVVRAKGSNANKLQSVVGSIAPFMDNVEQGQRETKKGKHGVAVPTGFAAGQKGANPTTKLVRSAFYIRKTDVGNINAAVQKFSKREQRNAVSMAMARRRGGKFNYAVLESDKGFGLYKINQGKGKLRRKSYSARLNPEGAGAVNGSSWAPWLLWSYHNSAVRMRPHPTLEPAAIHARRMMPNIFTAQLKKQFLFYQR